MLTIIIPEKKLWDNKNEVFINVKKHTLTLEHSLVSISKWEAKWHEPFIGDKNKTQEQTIDYIKFMTLTQNVDDNVYMALTQENFKEISEYINNKMTATWFSEPTHQPPGKKEVITSELIYYWMVALNIPFECQKWHLNRLLTFIKVCNAKAKSANKKTNKRDLMSKNADINAARRKKLGSTG